MKKLIVFLLVLLAANCSVQAQAPQGFNFQGIALDNNGFVVASKLVSLRFSICTDSVGNTVRYSETASVQTDKYGQFIAVIGNGVPIIGKFGSIVWSLGNLYMKTEIDIANTGKYVVTGLSQLLSVPYAMYANYAENKYLKVDIAGRNTGISDSVLMKNTTAIDNTSVGYASLTNNTSGRLNSSVGNYSMYNNSTGSNNSVVGVGALNKNSTGGSNNAVGVNALYFNTTGSFNSAYGNSALYGNTTGTQNTAIGYNSMYVNSIGYQNTALGNRSLYLNTTGNNNTAIGYNSGAKLTTGAKNIFIGNEAGSNNNFVTTSNKLVIQNDSSLTPLIYGEFDNKKVTINGDLTVTGKLNESSGSGNIAKYIKTDSGRYNAGIFIGQDADFKLANNNNPSNLVIGIGAGYSLMSKPNTAISGYNNDNNVIIGNHAGGYLRADENANGGMAATLNVLVGNYVGEQMGAKSLSNTFIGWETARFSSASDWGGKLEGNVAIGGRALQYAKKANANVVLGDNTFNSSTNVNSNVALGNNLGYSFLKGDNNVLIGSSTLDSVSSGNKNIIIGSNAISKLNGDANVLIGYNVADQSKDSISNKLYIANSNTTSPLIYGEFDNKKLTINGDLTVTGKISGADGILSDAYGNTKAGSSALDNNKNSTTSGTVAIGDSALKYNYGIGNTAIGSKSMKSKYLSSSDANTAIGNSSLYSNTSGSANTSSGYQSMFSSTIGFSNTAVGTKSLYASTTGSRNTALGDSTMLKNTTGSYNTATGYLSLSSNTTGEFNSAYGSYSMEKNTTGNENIAFGGEAFRNNTTGSFNVAVGTGTLGSNTTGGENTAIGRRAMNDNHTGTFNTAIGQAALYANKTGSNNTAMGRTSLVYNTVGEFNTAIGATSITNNTTGSSNTGIGYNVLGANTTGNQNTAVGYNAGAKSTNGNKNIFIGYEAGNNFNFSSVSNKLVIDNSNRPDPLMVGDFSSRKLILNGDPASMATLEIKNGDTYISNPNKGIILTSPNGSCWRVTVDNAGALIRTSVACPSSLNPKLGDVYQGGIVFYIDSTGEHGLVAAATDQSAGGTGWGCSCTLISGLDSAFGSGSTNTAEIVRQCANAGIAAKECFDLVLNGYSDWYLPSKLELDLMYTKLKLNGLGNFLTNMPYWSSTPASYGSCGATGGAWTKNFGTGANIADARNGYAGTGAVRAIRSF